MKFAGTVVLYNPDREILENMQTYLPFIDVLYVMDNSTKEYDFLDDIKNIKKVKYISLDGNKGIAKALKVATETAIADGYDFLLSMDQDSKFPTEDFKYIENYLENSDTSNLGIAGVNFNLNKIKQLSDKKSQVIEVNEVITSGSFLNLHNYKKIEGYNEDLFIDFVDDDLCYQFLEKKIEVIIFVNIFLNHRLGNVIQSKFLWKTKNIVSHSPVRYYYIYRNYNYLIKFKNVSYSRHLLERKMEFCFKSQLIQSLFERKRLKTLKMIRRGIRDGKRGRLGPYEERRKKK